MLEQTKIFTHTANTENADGGLPLGIDAPWLAPLAGYSDLSFRLLCREYGAKVVFSEMVSAKGLVYGGYGSDALMVTNEQDAPMVLQLFGNECDIMERAMQKVCGLGFDYFDLNMGCSVKKVSKTGCGAAMLREVDNAVRVAETMLSVAGKGHVGFKFRLGWDMGEEIYLDLGKELAALGAGWLTLHPRYAKQRFSGTARWSALQELVDAVDVPVIASGDLLSAEQGAQCMKESGVAGLMFARGAICNPAIFEDFTALMHGNSIEKTTEDGFMSDTQLARLQEIIRRHIALAKEYCDDRSALFKMRSFVPRYVRSFSGARALRSELSLCRSWEHLERLMNEFFTCQTEKSGEFAAVEAEPAVSAEAFE